VSQTIPEKSQNYAYFEFALKRCYPISSQFLILALKTRKKKKYGENLWRGKKRNHKGKEKF
jgi:hypothetical protein